MDSSIIGVSKFSSFIDLYYTDKNNETFLLASKFIPYEKCGVNHVFTFDLMEREDGSIGIQMPKGDMTDEETGFD